MLSLLPLSFYIHWPFCRKICPYCDFNKYDNILNREDLSENYIKEIEYYSNNIDKEKFYLNSIYFGGGTPSIMPISLINDIINYLQNTYTYKDNLEITIECNPSFLDVEKLKDLKNAGVNRLSLGIQSINDKDLELLGRDHTAKDSIECFNKATNIFDNISIDLMYARPWQSVPEWEGELKEVLNIMSPNHISLYELTIKEGTPYYNKYKKLKDDVLAEFYELTNDIISSNKFNQYEISSYSKIGFESLHNLSYWLGYDYVGIGAGAEGRITMDGKRYGTYTHKLPHEWSQSIKNNGHGMQDTEEMDDLKQLTELLLTGLRTSYGVDLSKWNINSFVSTDKLESLIHSGHLKLEKNILSIPKNFGLFVIKSLIYCYYNSCFFDDLYFSCCFEAKVLCFFKALLICFFDTLA